MVASVIYQVAWEGPSYLGLFLTCLFISFMGTILALKPTLCLHKHLYSTFKSRAEIRISFLSPNNPSFLLIFSKNLVSTSLLYLVFCVVVVLWLFFFFFFSIWLNDKEEHFSHCCWKITVWRFLIFLKSQVFCIGREQHVKKTLLESVSGKYLMKILDEAE